MGVSSTSFKPGEVHNPNGRPKKGYSITEWFREMLNSNPEMKDAIGKSIIKQALSGDTTAQKLVWNYMDGMPEQSTKSTNIVVEAAEDESLPPEQRLQEVLERIKRLQE
jgi:hypothetical protein